MGKQVILAAGLLTGVLILSSRLEAGGVGPASTLSGLLMVGGGTVCVALTIYPWRRLARTARVVRESFLPPESGEEVIQSVVDLARDYRRGWDIRTLEEQARGLSPGLLKTGVELIAYQADRDELEEILRGEGASILDRYERAEKVLHHLAQAAVSLGLMGTLLNLIRFLGLSRDLPDLAACGAAALLSTLCGALLARLGFLPLAGRLNEWAADERFRQDLIREGVLGILDREHPRAIRFKLEAYLAAREPVPAAPREPAGGRLREAALEGGEVGSILPG